MTLAILGGSPMGSAADHRRWPVIDEDDQAAVSRALRRAQFGANGAVIGEAEEHIADAFGSRYALLVNSATDGLTAAQLAVGVRSGEHVVQSAYSFAATPQSTLATGAQPLFVDIRPDTHTLAVNRLREMVTRRTAAIMPVAIHGLLCDVKEIQEIADEHEIPVIWDNAQAAGGTTGPYSAGTTGHVSVSSLNYKKIWCADQGGVIFTDDAEINRALRRYAHYGTGPLTSNRQPSYWTSSHGVNLAPPTATAALAVSRLSKLHGHVATAQRNMSALASGLRGLPGLVLPYIPADTVTTWSRPRVQFNPAELGWTGTARELRDRIITALRGEGLPVRSWQEWPLPAHTAFRHEHAVTWSPRRSDAEPSTWHPDHFPVTVGLLEASVMLADDPFPLWDQPLSIVTDHYIPAFRKVWGEMDAVMQAAFDVERPAPWPDGR